MQTTQATPHGGEATEHATASISGQARAGAIRPDAVASPARRSVLTRRRVLGLILAMSLVVAASYARRASPSAATIPEGTVTPAVASDTGTATDRAELDRLLGVFAARAPQRAESLEYRTLGRLYLDRALLTGNLDDYVGAADAYEAALALAPGEPEALTGMARASLAVHEFTSARELAERALARDPGRLDAIAVAGDAALAVGDLARADDYYATLADALAGDAGVLVRLAYLAYERGDAEGARALAADAVRTAERTGLAGPRLGFYQAAAARLEFATGHHRAALRLARSATETAPELPAAWSQLARALAATGRTDEAVAAVSTAVGMVPDPDDLAFLGDLYTLQGRLEDARLQYGTVEVVATLAAANRSAYNRSYARYLLDHGLEPARALDLAERELATRRDAGGYDVYAWALYRNGRFDEAREAIDLAMATGKRDAATWYHAGLVSLALDDQDRGFDEIATALAINPAFDPLLAVDAAALLEERGR